jgi:hypothetical protein
MTPQKGDPVIYCGHLYTVAFTITFNDGSEKLALRQNHWPPQHHIVVSVKDCLVDVPITA